jgi:hypothetical protein
LKLLITSKDSIYGSELADGLRHHGHTVLSAWSAGEALLLARGNSPSIALIDQCHDVEPEAAKLARYLLEQRIGIIWLGCAPDPASYVPGVPVALLRAPCNVTTVVLAVAAVSRGVNAHTAELYGFTLLNQ